MTKLKNTKKGMAKKALSISLVAAMLATSNVPVWAAEDLFSDGSAAVEAPVVVEEPAAEVQTFSAEAETPVVEDAEPQINLQANESKYDFSDVKYETNFDWKRTESPFTGGTIKNENGNNISSGELKYVWQLDGIDITGNINDAADNLSSYVVPLTKEDIGSKLSVRFFEEGKKDVTVAVIDLGTVQARNVTAAVDKLNFENEEVWYTGNEREIKQIPESIDIKSNEQTFKVSDFDWSFSAPNGVNVGTVTVTGTLKSSKASETGYAGTVSGTYKIVPMEDAGLDDYLQTEITITDKSEIEYAEKKVSIPTSAVTAKIKGTDITLPVESVSVDASDLTDQVVEVIFDKDALNKTGNFNLAREFTRTSTDTVKVVSRDLSKNTAKVTKSFSSDYIQNSTSQFLSDLKTKIAITGADGRVVNPSDLGNNVIIELADSVQAYKNPGTYKNAIIIKAVSGQDEVKNSVYADLIVSTGAFADDANFVGSTSVKTYANAQDALNSDSTKQEYTGKEITFTNAQLGNYFDDGKGNKQDLSIFDIKYNNNINASTSKTNIASITVTGKAGTAYEGCFTTVYFAIKPAMVKVTNNSKTTTVTTAVKDAVKGVEINESYTDAKEYKDAIGLAIKAENGATPKATFNLADGTDYTCEYSFVNADGNALSEKDDYNAAGNQVKVVATIKNSNYDVSAFTRETLSNGVTISADNTKDTITLLVPIVDKTIAGTTITLEKDSYTFTGENIIPKLTVKDGDTVLKEGKHYKVSVKNGIHAGTATVVVTALAGSGYREGSTLEKDFTITKAKAEDVEVKVTYAGEIKYDGKAWDDTRTGLSYSVKLNGVEVDKYFKVKWGENINAGKTAGKLTLTPTTTGAKDFEGTKEATFEIKGTEIAGTLTLYDENGSKITNIPAYFYSGTPVTFAKTKFDVTAGTDAKLVEGKDYEIKYIDNVAAGTGYVCVVGKGNYTGAESVTADDGTVIDNIIAGTKISFTIKGMKFSAKDITVSNGTYASGLVVKPNVTVISNGKTLVEGVDYKLVFDADKAINATIENNIRLTVEGINGYNGVEVNTTADGKYLVFGIDKFNLENSSVMSDGKTVVVRNGNVIVPSSEYTYEIADGKVTVTATADNKNYTGSKTVDITEEETFVGAPVITEVQVNGNKATVILEGEAEGATGYDYVISTVNNYTDGRLSNGINKNQLATQTSYQYLDQGIYYAYCHAWTRDENGNKVFGEWSNIMPFSVSSITPDQPSITKVEKSSNGKHLRITWTKSANATGYDVVMGTKLQKVNGEYRPTEYGKAVKKITNGNTVSVIFYNIPKGTYYVGLHAYNRTSETGVKVFSPWSNSKKVTF